jgi:predicted TIM-barrel fold metal-dependent hydrolase
LVTDELGYTWVSFGDQRLSLGGPHRPGDVQGVGAFRQRWVDGLPADFDLAEFSSSYSDPAARLIQLDRAGFDASIMFPNYGIGWERALQDDLRATLANMTAWNRWIVQIAAEGNGRLYPVAHLSLRDLAWLESQLTGLANGGIRVALISPSLVDGLPLSHPSLDRAWSVFVDHGISPVFHVANQPRPFAETWYGEIEGGFSPLAVAFIWTGAALALTDLIFNGVFERYPDLRMGVMELGSRWVPEHLRLMDGGYRFTAQFNGESTQLPLSPSDYFRRQVRVASFSHEDPNYLKSLCGDIFMACSDYPHTEGTATPFEDYNANGVVPEPSSAGFFGNNAAFLLRKPLANQTSLESFDQSQIIRAPYP